MRYLSIILGILPVILIGIFYYLRDTLKEPPKLLRNLFICGIVSALLVITISFITVLLFPNYGDMENASFLKLFIYTFIFVAFVEEFFKWIMIYKIAYNNPECEQLYDIIIYSVYVGLGFAFFENLIYIIPEVNGIWLAILRGLTAIPGHTCFQTFMGYYLSLAKKTNQKKYITLSLIIPTIVHGTYDFLLYTGNIILAIFFFIFIIIMFIISLIKINQIIQIDKFNLNSKKIV